MKVQGINNQSNISHKAYFKQNEILEKLYKKAKKTEDLVKFSRDLKTKTPNHELEITGILKNKNYPNMVAYEIVNKATEKIETIITAKGELGLLGILAHLLLFKDQGFFRVDEKETDVDCLAILTKKD